MTQDEINNMIGEMSGEKKETDVKPAGKANVLKCKHCGHKTTLSYEASGKGAIEITGLSVGKHASRKIGRDRWPDCTGKHGHMFIKV